MNKVWICKQRGITIATNWDFLSNVNYEVGPNCLQSPWKRVRDEGWTNLAKSILKIKMSGFDASIQVYNNVLCHKWYRLKLIWGIAIDFLVWSLPFNFGDHLNVSKITVNTLDNIKDSHLFSKEHFRFAQVLRPNRTISWISLFL